MFLEIGLNRHEYPFYEEQLILDLGIDSSFCDFQLPHLNIPSPASAGGGAVRKSASVTFRWSKLVKIIVASNLNFPANNSQHTRSHLFCR